MDVTVVCPFFNEIGIIETSIRELVASLSTLSRSWELIVVNDGSTDGSAEVAHKVAAEFENVRVLGYASNRGRGHALRTGIAEARGDLIATTEIDLSWGERIVHDLLAEFDAHPDTDVVVASPHLPGGGYHNVPPKRVLLSTLGNRVIRTCVSNATTMNTGMTRCYRREAIRSLPLFEDGKEFHLEVILKAVAFGFRIREIPATLEWKDYKHKGKRVKRKSSSNVNRLIFSHSLFSLFANPVRYVLTLSIACLALGAVSLAAAVVLIWLGEVAAFTGLLGVSLVILGLIFFVLGVVARQGNMIQRELWMVQRFMMNPPAASRGDASDREPPGR